MSRLERQFLEFHYSNPQVYKMFNKLAWQAIEQGQKKCGSKEIWEQLRWHFRFTTTDKNFKLCNNHTPYYARLWLANNPAYSDFFVLRKVEGDDDDEPPTQGELF